jgi:hypothetical protein
MTKLNLEYCQNRHHEIQVELDKMDELKERENRAFTEDEVTKYRSLIDEDARLNNFMEGQLTGKKLEEHRERKAKSQMLRELFKKCREEKVAYSEDMHDREAANGTTILLNPAAGNTKGNIEASGAIPLVIHELIDTKVPGLERPGDLKILTGVTGNQVWPYAIDDVEFEVADEVEQIGEQKINFSKLNASPVRVAASLAISNEAIDNADFDLYGFCDYKMKKGMAKFMALYTYSHCKPSHALKPVFGLVDVEEISLDDQFAENLDNKIAEMWDLGFEGEPWLTMDKTIETKLKYKKAIPGTTDSTRTVIEDGKCLNHEYTVSPYINYALNGQGKPAADGNHYIGIGHWGYCAFQQHGTVRATVDSTSAEVSKRNTTVLVLNTFYSISELSSKVNGNTSGKPQAFKLLKVVTPASSSEL